MGRPCEEPLGHAGAHRFTLEPRRSNLDELLARYPPPFRSELEKVLIEQLYRLAPYIQHRESCQVDEHENERAGARMTCGMHEALGKDP